MPSHFCATGRATREAKSHHTARAPSRRPAFDGQAIDDGEARPVVEALLDLAHEGARGVEREIVRAQQQERQGIAIQRRDDPVELLFDRGRKRDASGVGGQIIAAPQQALGQRCGEIGDVEHAPTIPAPAQSRKSSLIEVFDRVRSSTVFVMITQYRAGRSALPPMVPGWTTE